MLGPWPWTPEFLLWPHSPDSGEKPRLGQGEVRSLLNRKAETGGPDTIRAMRVSPSVPGSPTHYVISIPFKKPGPQNRNETSLRIHQDG